MIFAYGDIKTKFRIKNENIKIRIYKTLKISMRFMIVENFKLECGCISVENNVMTRKEAHRVIRYVEFRSKVRIPIFKIPL